MRTRVIVMLAVAGVLTVGGCRRSVEGYGRAVPDVEAVAVKDLIGQPHDFTSMPVVVEGRIVRECPTGCWFDLDAGGAPLYVELGDAGLAIPQRVGKTVRVVGNVSAEGGQVKLSGEGVEIR